MVQRHGKTITSITRSQNAPDVHQKPGCKDRHGSNEMGRTETRQMGTHESELPKLTRMAATGVDTTTDVKN